MFTQYLRSKKPSIVKNPRGFGSYGGEDYDGTIIIPPLNTNIRFSDTLPLHKPSDIHEQAASTAASLKSLSNLPKESEIYEPQYQHILSSLKDVNASMGQPSLVIPPLNTDIRFSEVLPTFIGQTHLDAKTKTYSHLSTAGGTVGAGGPAAGSPDHVRGKIHTHDHTHENFSWTIPSQHDDEHAILKKLLIQPVFDQQACGSCWAVATATTMSDCLVVGEAVNWSPNISTTFCMACYPQALCNGGMPAELALAIQRGGVADTTCMDYSWCQNNDKCNIRDSSKHFEIDSEALSNQVPDCGCLFNADKYYYHLDPGTDTFSITSNRPVKEYRQLVKYHILDFGPVVGGYLVLNNFLNGRFTESNEGVYFDRADYSNISPDGTINFSDSVRAHTNSAGLHAVSIVGWGVAKNIQYDNNQVGDVPFWYCRNSWGSHWGDGGFFKLAMYPFNETAQFDKVVTVRVGGNPANIGGLMLIRTTKPPEIRPMDVISTTMKSSINLIKGEDFYNRDAEVGGVVVRRVTSPNINLNMVIVGVLIVGIILYLTTRK